jgi:ribosomal protein S18 acetylase RimI-like enzyme
MVNAQDEMNNFQIILADSPEQIQIVKELFIEYAHSLNFDLCFQNFDKEVAGLPGEYAPPDGTLLLAKVNRKDAGCVALRKIDSSTCEMKRLYVRPEFRGRGMGRSLAIAVIREAIKIGYSSMKLDTVPSMKEAIPLYQSLGFREIKPYRLNPIENAIYMELDLKNFRG